jgi:hypothetical protein
MGPRSGCLGDDYRHDREPEVLQRHGSKQRARRCAGDDGGICLVRSALLDAVSGAVGQSFDVRAESIWAGPRRLVADAYSDLIAVYLDSCCDFCSGSPFAIRPLRIIGEGLLAFPNLIDRSVLVRLFTPLRLFFDAVGRSRCRISRPNGRGRPTRSRASRYGSWR